MAASVEVGQADIRRRGFVLPFIIVAALFGVVEYLIESVPGLLFVGLNLDSKAPSVISLYNTVDAAVRVALVPFALFLVFYVLAERTRLDLRRYHFAVALSIFVGTVLVFLPIDVGQALTGPPSPGFNSVEAVVVSMGDSLSSSLNHVFIGFSAVFLWTLVARPPGSAPYFERKEGLHGTEDISIVGVVMALVYIWQYMAQAYQATYLMGVKDQTAAIFASLLGGGSAIYYTVAVWQQAVLLMVLPFTLYFLVARREKLNPFVQGRKMAIIVLLWALFLRLFTSYFYVYFAQVFDPAAFVGQTMASTIAGEFVPMNLIPIIASSFAFLFLGMTAMVFGFFAREKAAEEVAPSPPLPVA